MPTYIDRKAIGNSPTNNSKSKAQYSFPKSQRFKDPNKTSDVFYNLPQTKSKRKTTLGYGKKIDWDMGKDVSHIVPPPNTYSPPDFVKMNKTSQKGFSTKVGRQDIKSQSFIKLDQGIPGPGTYGSTTNFKKDGPQYSMRPNTASQVFVRKSSLLIPGPGTYGAVDDLNIKGKYYTSRNSSSRSKKFDPSSSRRFKQTKSEAPGPGKYTPKSSVWENGQEMGSKFKSSGNRLFSTGQRKTIFEQYSKKYQNIPGPGTYASPSEFGNYQKLDMSCMFQSTSKPKRRNSIHL